MHCPDCSGCLKTREELHNRAESVRVANTRASEMVKKLLCMCTRAANIGHTYIEIPDNISSLYDNPTENKQIVDSIDTMLANCGLKIEKDGITRVIKF